METVVIKRDWREYKYLDAVAPEDIIIAKAQPPVKEKKQKPQQQNNSESESESKSSQSKNKEGKSKQNTSQSKENKNEEKTEQTQGKSKSQENKNEYKPDIHQGNKEANIEAETKKSDKEKQHESDISEKGEEKNKENKKKETPEIGDDVIFPEQNGEKKKYRLIAIDKNKFDCTIQDSKGNKSATRLSYLQKAQEYNSEEKKSEKENEEKKESVSAFLKMPPLSSVNNLQQQKAIQVNQSFDFGKSKQNRTKSALARIISSIAEDETNLATEGNDVISMNLLLQRKITRNPVSRCMQGLERERVAIFLDTSGSCYALSKLYSGILQSAFKDNNVELYEVPNAKFEKEWNGKEWVRTAMDWGNFRGRTILYFGDFDGADENIIPNSRYNKIFWLFYERFYTWISTEEIKSRQTMFRGKIIPCSTEEQFVGAIKKIH